jgi:hypothetical protein
VKKTTAEIMLLLFFMQNQLTITPRGIKTDTTTENGMKKIKNEGFPAKP